MPQLSLVLSDDDAQYQTILGQFINTAATSVAADVVLAQTAATQAIASATSAGNSASSAAANAISTAADRVQTDADVVTTNTAATNAGISATNSGNSAAASAASATAAGISATNAATSATNAATTLANALTKASNLSDVASAAISLSNLGGLSSATAATTYAPINGSANYAPATGSGVYATITNLNLKAPLASPTFTGTVTIPAGASISGYAPLASPVFTGTPSLPTGTTGVTQATATNNTSLATTAYVKSQNYAALSGNQTFSGIQTISTSGQAGSLIITDSGGNGANIKLTGNGTTTPSKVIRAGNGSLQFVNDAYSAVIMTVTDNGYVSALSGFMGIAGGSTPVSGQIGEYQQSTVSTGVSIASGTAVNLTSISLPAGNWAVQGNMIINASSGTMGAVFSAVSLTSATLTSSPISQSGMINTAAIFAQYSVATPVVTINLGSTTTVYLVGQVNWNSGSSGTYLANLRAQRIG